MTSVSRTLLAAALVVATIAISVPTSDAAQQTSPSRASAAPSTAMPGLIGMCEDSDGCSDWGFNGNQGIGLSADGAKASLTITHLDAKSIAIHRVLHSALG